MNQHLNIFRYFNESQASEFIENNLSRAFAICLKGNSLFFSRYIQSIVDNIDYEYLFNYFDTDTRYDIDLQVNTNSFEFSGIRKVYAVAMTADRMLDMNDFLQLKPSLSKQTNYTDVLIVIKDIAFVIEVKRHSEDCRQQLFDQIVPFLSGDSDVSVIGKNFSWKHTMVIMEQVSNIEKLRGLQGDLISDFINLAEIRYPYWFSSRPFHQLPPLSDGSQKSVHARHLRLKQIISNSGQKILDYSDRMAIGIDYGWASEIIPSFNTYATEDFIVFTIWPGNTKGQGYHIYPKSLEWIKKTQFEIGDKIFEIDIEYHMKFCHFNRFIVALDFNNDALLKPINTQLNFYSKSGKWNIDDWSEFETFMDEHFIPEFNWREKSQFDKYFTNSDRTYFTVSSGFMADLYVPYKFLQNIDKEIDNKEASEFINELVLGFKKLINN